MIQFDNSNFQIFKSCNFRSIYIWNVEQTGQKQSKFSLHTFYLINITNGMGQGLLFLKLFHIPGLREKIGRYLGKSQDFMTVAVGLINIDSQLGLYTATILLRYDYIPRFPRLVYLFYNILFFGFNFVTSIPIIIWQHPYFVFMLHPFFLQLRNISSIKFVASSSTVTYYVLQIYLMKSCVKM